MDKQKALTILDKIFDDKAEAYEVVDLVSYLLDSQLKSPRHLFGDIEEVEIVEDTGLYSQDDEEEILAQIEYEEEGMVCSHHSSNADAVPEFGFRCIAPVDNPTYCQAERLSDALRSALTILDSVTTDEHGLGGPSQEDIAFWDEKSC